MRRSFSGCVHQYCYCREKKYYLFEDPRDFVYRIEMKENAPRLLRQALICILVDIIRAGDYQAVERKYGVSDRMPRPVISGGKRELIKRVVEALASQCYWLELDNAPGQRVSAYRKAAWMIEDLEQDIGLIYRQMGGKRLESIENLGPRMAEVIEDLLSGLLTSPAGCGPHGLLG